MAPVAQLNFSTSLPACQGDNPVVSDILVPWQVHSDSLPGAQWRVMVVSRLGPAAVADAQRHGGDVARCVATVLTRSGLLRPELLAGHGCAADGILLFERPAPGAPPMPSCVVERVRVVLGRASVVVAAYPDSVGEYHGRALGSWRDAGFRAFRDGLWLVPAASMR